MKLFDDFSNFISNRLMGVQLKRVTVNDFIEKGDLSEANIDKFEKQIEVDEEMCYKLGFFDALSLILAYKGGEYNHERKKD